MHLSRLRKTDRFAGESFQARPKIEVLPFNTLRLSL
jgi:hypothetical protein